MTTRKLAALLVALAPMGCGDEEPTPTPIGTWGWADPTDRHAVHLSLQGQDYIWLKLGLTLDTLTDVEVHMGTFAIGPSGLVLTHTMSTCPDDRKATIVYQVSQPDNETLLLDGQYDSFRFSRAYMPRPEETGTFGCYADDGAFTASPLATLPALN